MTIVNHVMTYNRQRVDQLYRRPALFALAVLAVEVLALVAVLVW